MADLIIDDTTPESVWTPPSGLSTGLKLAFRGPGEYAYGSVAERFPTELLIPRSEWQARIEEMEEQESRISDILKQDGIGPKNQQQTNYCWIFGPTRAFEIIRMLQGQKFVSLSPASAGAQIKGYKNVGGWGQEGLEWIVEKGLVPSEKWPDTAIDKRYATEENKRLALNYRCTEWWELGVRNVDQLISCLLRRIPVAVGYNWWSHEVCAVDPVWKDGTAAIRILNSWGGWGDNGYGILAGNKMPPDDAVAPRVAMAS